MGGHTSRPETQAAHYAEVVVADASSPNREKQTNTLPPTAAEREQVGAVETVTGRAANLQRRLTVSNVPSREVVEAHVREECEDLLLRGVEHGKDGWERVFENGEKLRVWRRKVSGKSSAYEYALKGKTEHPPHVFFKTAFLDLDHRVRWDESCGEARLLDRCDRTGAETLYWVTQYPWPVAERDYVFQRVYSRRGGLHNGEFHAVSWVGRPPQGLFAPEEYRAPSDDLLQQVPKHRVRVEDYRTAMMVRPSAEGGAIWCLRVLDDPRVAVIPSSVVNWIVSKTLPSSAKKLEEACASGAKSRQ